MKYFLYLAEIPPSTPSPPRPYPTDQYWWQWNERNNLEGFNKSNDNHIFTWQPHGSQFTIIEDVPPNRLAIKIQKPPQLERNDVLKSINFDDSWVQIL